MNGTITTKIGRLCADLIQHPSHLRRYVRHNVVRESPIDLELPWISYAAIDFLEDWLAPEMTVCEFGSGGSTCFFARRVSWVYSIEDNAEWYVRVKDKLEEKGLNNVTLMHCPFDFKNPRGFENSDYLNSMPDGDLDVIVIDSSEEWTPVRPMIFAHAEIRIKPGGIIVMDDSWRYQSLRAHNSAKAVETFKSAGPGRPGVTTTDVFIY